MPPALPSPPPVVLERQTSTELTLVVSVCFVVVLVLMLLTVYMFSHSEKPNAAKTRKKHISIKEDKVLQKIRFYLRDNSHCWLKVVIDQMYQPFEFNFVGEFSGIDEITGDIIPLESEPDIAEQETSEWELETDEESFEEVFKKTTSIPEPPVKKVLIQRLIYNDIDMDDFIDQYYGEELQPASLDEGQWLNMDSEQQRQAISEYFLLDDVSKLQSLRCLIGGFLGLRRDMREFIQGKIISKKQELMLMCKSSIPHLAVCTIQLIRDVVLYQQDFMLSIDVYLEFVLSLLQVKVSYTSIYKTACKAIFLMVEAVDVTYAMLVMKALEPQIKKRTVFTELVLEILVMCLCRHRLNSKSSNAFLKFLRPHVKRLGHIEELRDLLENVTVAATELKPPPTKLIDQYKEALKRRQLGEIQPSNVKKTNKK